MNFCSTINQDVLSVFATDDANNTKKIFGQFQEFRREREIRRQRVPLRFGDLLERPFPSQVSVALEDYFCAFAFELS